MKQFILCVVIALVQLAIGAQHTPPDYVRLKQALDSGDVQNMKSLLGSGRVDINAFSRASKRTILHRALFKGQKEMAKLLLDEGADPIVPGSDGVTPLISAVQGLNFDVVKLIAEHLRGLDYKKRLNQGVQGDNEGNAGIHHIALKGADPRAPEIAEYLIHAYAMSDVHQKNNAGKKPIELLPPSAVPGFHKLLADAMLLTGAKNGDLDGVKDALSRGAEINIMGNGRNALHKAA